MVHDKEEPGASDAGFRVSQFAEAEDPSTTQNHWQSKSPASLSDLAEDKRWVAWQEEVRNGDPGVKVPKDPATGGNAKIPTDPSTYGTRAAAEHRFKQIEASGSKGGVGIVLGKLRDGCCLTGIDLDNCRTEGAISNLAREVIDRFDTYAEVSPSNLGAKLFFLMIEADAAKLLTFLGTDEDGKQKTRKTFAVGKHREVAIDTARFYAVTGQRLDGTPEHFRLVPFADVAWFVEEIGPRYRREAFEAAADQQSADRDQSGSGFGFRFMVRCHARSMSYEQARAAIMADGGPAGEWANRTGERQIKRAWQHSKQPAQDDDRQRKGATLVRAKDIVMRPKDWLWPGHLLRGAQELLTGIPGLGKSQVQISLIACATTGRAWPNGSPGCAPTSVIMLTAEDTLDSEVVPRLAAAGADLGRVHILKSIRSDGKDRQFLLAEDLEQLEEAASRIGGVGLITIDPITAYMGGKMDSHKTTEVRSQLGPLKDLAERTNIAISTITHPPKSAGQRAIDHYIGSQAFIAAGRIGHICIQELIEDDDGPKATGRILFATPKHNPSAPMPTLAYRIKEEIVQDIIAGVIVTTHVAWDAGPVDITADEAVAQAAAANKSKRDSAQAKVQAFLLELTEDGPVPVKKAIEEAAKRGFTEKQVRTARTKLGFTTVKRGGIDGIWELAQLSHRITDDE